MPASDPQQAHNELAYMMQGVNRANSEIDYADISREFGPWITPTLLNSYANPLAPRRKVQYRMNYRLDKHEFRGHVDPGDATSGTTVFTIDEPYILDYTYDFATHFITGTTFTIASIVVNATSGNVVAYWTPNP